jgi:hypothetical protein
LKPILGANGKEAQSPAWKCDPTPAAVPRVERTSPETRIGAQLVGLTMNLGRSMLTVT